MPGAREDRDPRVARVGGVGLRAQAEREDGAPGVGDELLVDAAVAEAAVGPALGHAVKAGRASGSSTRAPGAAASSCWSEMSPRSKASADPVM